MNKITKEEAMGYRGKNVRRFFLLAGVGVLACALAGALCGCGSNEPEPLSRQDKRSATTATARPQVKEILPKGSPAASLPQARLLGREDLGPIPVFPPDKYGKPGPTLAEVHAKAEMSRQVDPNLVHVFPPDELGNPGPTLAEVQAKAAASMSIDPSLVPAFPPDESGKPRPTVAEVRAKIAAAQQSASAMGPMVAPDKTQARKIVMPADNVRR